MIYLWAMKHASQGNGALPITGPETGHERTYSILTGCKHAFDYWTFAVRCFSESQLLRLVSRIEGDFRGDNERKRALDWTTGKVRAYVHTWGLEARCSPIYDNDPERIRKEGEKRTAEKGRGKAKWLKKIEGWEGLEQCAVASQLDFSWARPLCATVLDHTMTTEDAVNKSIEAIRLLREYLTSGRTATDQSAFKSQLEALGIRMAGFEEAA